MTIDRRKRGLLDQPSKSPRFSFDLSQGRKALLRWYQQNKRPLPWRVRFAESGDPYHIWVSEIMLQQTIIKVVIPAYDRFLSRFPTLDKLALATADEVKEQVRGLGYYRRFNFLHLAAKQLHFDSIGLPADQKSWMALPGVGDYTSAAISSIALGIPAAVVDGNVERVFCRLMDIRKPPNLPELKRQFKILALDFLDQDQPGDFNQALMELGQVVCTPTSPSCYSCPISSGCLARKNGTQHLAPAPKIQKKFEDVNLHLEIYSKANKIGLIERQSDSRFLKGTWGFSTTDKKPTKNRSARLCGVIKHSITHHKIEASVWISEAASEQKGVKWLSAKDVEKSLISNLDRKAWDRFLDFKKRSVDTEPTNLLKNSKKRLNEKTTVKRSQRQP